MNPILQSGSQGQVSRPLLLPSPPSLWASLVTPSAPSPCPHSWLCHPALTDLPTVNSHTLYACLSVCLSPETYSDNSQQKIHHLMVSVGHINMSAISIVNG